MNLRLIGKLFGVGVALVLVALAGGNLGQSGWAQDCTVIVYPGQSINQAISNASPGAVICLSAGTWYEWNISISKPVTIIGAGQNATFIIGNNKDHGFRHQTVARNTPVTIKNLTVGHHRSGIVAGDQGRSYLVIENVTTQYNYSGFSFGDFCMVLPPGTPGAGQVACSETHLWIRNNIIQNNTFGISIGGNRSPIIEECVNNTFKNNTYDFNSEYARNRCSS